MTIRRSFAKLLASFSHLSSSDGSSRDPWERMQHYQVPLTAFGPGNHHDFDWYFQGESAVQVSSLDEIQEWLLACQYVRDDALFNEADFWQHPRTFEQLRRGDCEDHALWAWRKLVELGFNADLVTGTVLHPSDETVERGDHAWVLLYDDDHTLVFEAVAKSRERMIRSLDDVRDRYRPEFGVDRVRQRYAFVGALVAFNEREARNP